MVDPDVKKCDLGPVTDLANAVKITSDRTTEFKETWDRMAAIMTVQWPDLAGSDGFTRVTNLWTQATGACRDLEIAAENAVRVAAEENMSTVNRAVGYFGSGGGGSASLA